MKQNTLIALISTTLIFAACGTTVDNSGREQIAIPVVVEEIVTNSLEKFTTTNGTLVPMASADVTNKIDGIYKPAINPATGKYYKIGDMVKKGDVLATIEDESYLNSVSIDTKRISLEISESEYDKYVALEAKGGATQLDIKNAAMGVTTAQISYANAKISLEDMKVVSPIDGVIVDREYQTPNIEISSGIVLFSVMDYAKMLLDVSLSESTMSYIELGMPVYVTHYSISNRPVKAVIDQISPAIDSETRTYKAVIEVDNHDLLLRPGMFVQTDIVTASVEDAIVIPKSMVRTSRGRSYVYLADGTSAMQTEITTGIDNDTYVEVVSGLWEGDKLIVEGYETLRDRSKITIE
ncbi:MAG: efflux RND transporter periplasmic adaptor subunit [Rikenellaceae bacterium]